MELLRKNTVHVFTIIETIGHSGASLPTCPINESDWRMTEKGTNPETFVLGDHEPEKSTILCGGECGKRGHHNVRTCEARQQQASSGQEGEIRNSFGI